LIRARQFWFSSGMNGAKDVIINHADRVKSRSQGIPAWNHDAVGSAS
jgi:hypothetical protein